MAALAIRKRDKAAERTIVRAIQRERWALCLRISVFVLPMLALLTFGSWKENLSRMDQAGRPEEHAIGVVEHTTHLIAKLGDTWQVTVRLPDGHRVWQTAWNYGWIKAGEPVDVRYVVGHSGQYYPIRISPLATVR